MFNVIYNYSNCMPKAKGEVAAERTKLLFFFPVLVPNLKKVDKTLEKNEKRITAVALKSRDARN